MASNLWDIDVGRSSIRFSVRHMIITKVHGCFARWSGTIALDEQDLARSSVDVRIDAASIEARWAARDAQVADRDARLKSADFLDVAKYPEIRFRSKRIDEAGSGYRLVGDLSLHGVEHEVTLEAQFAGVGKDPWGNQRASFSARVALDRREYGLVWDPVLELGSVVVGEKVGIAIEIEAVKKVSSASVAA